MEMININRIKKKSGTSLGPIMLGLEGLELTPEERNILQHPQVAGVILFTRNYQNPEQLLHLVQTIRQNSSTHRLLIAVDQEGGRVQRFRTEFTSLPALNTIGNIYDEDPKKAHSLAKWHGWLMATELLAFDIDFSFSPVLDLQKNISTVIGNRAFHSNPKIVATIARTYIEGLQQAGMVAIGKHFPGHGSVALDSHIDLPIDNRSFKTICDEDLIPFKECSTILAGIMPAHIIFPEMDAVPAGFSKFWLQTVLREQLKFSGAIISDDLEMQGACQIGDMPQRAKSALAAGCDLVLICNDRKAAINVLDDLENSAYSHPPISAARLNTLYGDKRLTREELLDSVAWRQAVAQIQLLERKNNATKK